MNIEINENIPEEILITLDYIQLDLLATSGSNSARAAVILGVQTVGGNGGNDGSGDDDSNVALLVSTIVLGVLLGGYITATVAYYFIKIKPRSADFTTDFGEELKKDEKPRFVKNTASFSSTS